MNLRILKTLRNVFLIAILLGLGVAFLLRPIETKPSSLGVSDEVGLPQGPAHPAKFFDAQTFYPAVDSAKQSVKPLPYTMKGGIIPHHLLPSDMIARFFARLSYQPVKRVILIGPNHYEVGKQKILTSDYHWNTPFGIVPTDKKQVAQLDQLSSVEIENKVFENEHSMGGMMPFIKYYLPAAEVVPIILSSTVTLSETQTIAQAIYRLLDEYTVVIAPVDFSHYLSSNQAIEHDQITWDAIANRDYKRLFAMDNRFLDSPASIVTLMMVMENTNATRIDKYENTNSGIMVGDPHVETTSYFSVGFYK